MKKNKKTLATWFFGVRVDYKSHSFMCALLSDHTIDFYSYDSLLELHRQPGFVGRITGDPKDINRADAHQEEFTINVSGINPVIIESILKFQREDTPLEKKREGQELWINEMLEPYFWSSVNSDLPHPLKRPCQT